jgi:hypothetical protein
MVHLSLKVPGGAVGSTDWKEGRAFQVDGERLLVGADERQELHRLRFGPRDPEDLPTGRRGEEQALDGEEAHVHQDARDGTHDEDRVHPEPAA